MCKVKQGGIIKSVFCIIFDGDYTEAGMNAHIAKTIDIKTILVVFDQVFGTL